MGWLRSSKKYLTKMRDLEDTDVRRVVNENYSIIPRLSNMVSSIDEGYIPLNIIHSIIFNVLVYLYLYLFVVTCYLLRDDFVLVGVQFHYLLLALFGSVFQFHMYTSRLSFLQAHKIIALDFYTYEMDLLVDEKAKFKEYMLKQRRQLIPFMFLIGVIGMFIVGFGPLIDNMVGAGHDGDYLNGVYMKTPIPMYFPFEIDDAVSHYAATGFQIVTVVMLALSISGVVFMYVVTTQNLALQFRVLIASLNKLKERSKARFDKLYPNDKINPKNLSNDDKFQQCIAFCLRENIKHHQVMIKYYLIHARLIGVPILSAFFMGTFIIALSMIILVEKTDRYGLLMTNTLAMIGEVGNLFIACYFGEEILTLVSR
uniref:Odorant receptor n=1 Tax=Adelphocoris lineolatus TaxID=236346 RepID=A0A2I4PH18_ADELI|nr:olfactory receptor 19 [Adelphocoris lineolatus]